MIDQARLARMARALRQARTGRHADPARSRGDILLAVERGRRRRHVAVRAVTLLVASFLLSTAWAASDPARRAAFRGVITQWLRIEPNARLNTDPLRSPSASAYRLPARSEAPAPAEALLPPLVPSATPASSAVTSRRQGEPRASRAIGHLGTAASAPSIAGLDALPQEDEDNRLYGVAHRAHFQRQDPALALAAWNAYLHAMPDGRFTAEARYNRALCLVRLGRASDARAELEPFAAGKFGAYRREEARRLLALLDARE
jgi:hypothetical protein